MMHVRERTPSPSVVLSSLILHSTACKPCRILTEERPASRYTCINTTSSLVESNIASSITMTLCSFTFALPVHALTILTHPDGLDYRMRTFQPQRANQVSSPKFVQLLSGWGVVLGREQDDLKLKECIYEAHKLSVKRQLTLTRSGNST
jgi:hypothetical protein